MHACETFRNDSHCLNYRHSVASIIIKVITGDDTCQRLVVRRAPQFTATGECRADAVNAALMP